ncbi:MAG: hypothetical protein II863_09605 [Kiritimatiellae bacterium]|nr:hypothetical protein [Kiritimatiellia bacterium]
MKHVHCDKAASVLHGCLSALLLLAVAFTAGAASAKTTKGVWWWRGEDAANPSVAAKRLDFISRHGVGEIYFCVDLRKYCNETRAFVKAAGAKGMRVALLAGDVSWIRPGNRGFAETLVAYRSYQRHAAPDEKFYALHFDVEPHQDAKLSDERKWQLYADFVLRAAADVHAAGEKIEWDIPFWLDGIRVAYGDREDAPLLDVLTENSDCITLMSYRDTAEAMLDVSKAEIEMAKARNVRVVLGAETGETGEGSFVTFFEEGARKMDAELARVSNALDSAKVPAGAGIAIHHLGSWEKLAGKEKVK